MNLLPDDTSAHPGSYILAALQAGREGKAKRFVNAALFSAAAFEVGKKFKGRAKKELTHSVTLMQDDEIYGDVQEWLLSNIPTHRRRSLSARSYRSSTDDEDSSRLAALRNALMKSSAPGLVEVSSTKKKREGKLVLYYDGSREQTVKIKGHRVRVSIDKEDIQRPGETYKRVTETIRFMAATTEARERVIEFLTDMAKKKHEDGHSRLYVSDRWGDWILQDRPPRPIDTVILREGLKEGLVEDLRRFLTNEMEYVRMGAPWHRGYLFHGPPGTGKTSLAKALAELFEMDIYYIPLSDLEKDTALISLLSRLSRNSMLVLEDVDVVHAAKERDDAETFGISLSGILNALDGLITPHGLVTVMTTNDLDALDPALVRAGRADMVEELGFLDDDQLGRLLELVLGEKPDKIPPVKSDLTHAEVIESVKRCIGDPEAMKVSVMEMLHGKSSYESHSVG